MRKNKYGLQMQNILGCQVNTSLALYTCLYTVQSYWYKCRKQNMSAKERMEGIHKCSLMIRNK